MKEYFFSALTAVLSLAIFGVSARADTYTIQVVTTFDYPGATQTYPYGINDNNDVTGDFRDGVAYKGFIRTSDGQFSAPLVEPNDVQNDTVANGINNAGTVCGYYIGPTAYNGFFFSNGAYSQYDVPGSLGTLLQGINNAGDFTGIYYPPGEFPQGFLSVGGEVTTLSIPGGSYIQPWKINSFNQVAGFFTSVDGTYGFYTDRAGTVQYPVVVARSKATYLYGINDRGWIVGEWVDSARVAHGLFFVPPGTYVTLDIGSPLTRITGINNRGFVFVYYQLGNVFHGFIGKVKRSR